MLRGSYSQWLLQNGMALTWISAFAHRPPISVSKPLRIEWTVVEQIAQRKLTIAFALIRPFLAVLLFGGLLRALLSFGFCATVSIFRSRALTYFTFIHGTICEPKIEKKRNIY